MNCDEFIENYTFVKLLSNKNESQAIVLEHKKLGAKIVLHRFKERVAVYDMLKALILKIFPPFMTHIILQTVKSCFKNI